MYDRTVEHRVFEPGDQVLVLRSLVCSPFEAKFDGQYVVQHKLSDLNYVIATSGRKKSTKLCHINLLKPFYESKKEMKAVSPKSVQSALPAVSVLQGRSNVMGGEKEDIEPDDCILCGQLNNSESVKRILSHLPSLQHAELISVLTSFPDLFGLVKFVWSSNCAVSFENVKDLLCSSLVLAAPCFDRLFSLQVDASQVGAGAVPQQSDVAVVIHPSRCFFFLQKFSSYQQNYSVEEKEAIAVMWALQHFAVYVSFSQPVVVYTDHNLLTF